MFKLTTSVFLLLISLQFCIIYLSTITPCPWLWASSTPGFQVLHPINTLSASTQSTTWICALFANTEANCYLVPRLSPNIQSPSLFAVGTAFPEQWLNTLSWTWNSDYKVTSGSVLYVSAPWDIWSSLIY